MLCRVERRGWLFLCGRRCLVMKLEDLSCEAFAVHETVGI